MEQTLFPEYILYENISKMFVKCKKPYVRNIRDLKLHLKPPSGETSEHLEPSSGSNRYMMPRRRMSTGCFVSYLEEGDRKQLR